MDSQTDTHMTLLVTSLKLPSPFQTASLFTQFGMPPLAPAWASYQHVDACLFINFVRPCTGAVGRNRVDTPPALSP
jgi:hypothetical protein